MSLKYVNNNGEEVSIAGIGASGRDGEGIHVGTILAYNGSKIPDGYEKVEDPLAALRQEIYEAMWPIGRGFIDFTDTDYSNWLGLTWERELVGMFPVGYKSGDSDFGTIGKTGGEKTHTLTLGETPQHTHEMTRQQWYSADAVVSSDSGSIFSWKSTTGGTTSASYKRASGQTDLSYVGGSQAHNNLPPYQVVSYWKRVDPNAKTMISFTVICSNTTIGDKTYQAEEGMTWAQWVDSEYNVDGYFLYGTEVRLNDTYGITSDTVYVESTSIIDSNIIYRGVKSPM